MEITVSWDGPKAKAGGDMHFVATTDTGNVVEMDGVPLEAGTAGSLNARPMELVLIGTGGCAAYDVVLILRRARQQIATCEVSLKAERAETDPKVFTKIHFHFIVRGNDLNREKVERAIQLSNDKYCSASAMLAKTAVLSHSFEIVQIDR